MPGATGTVKRFDDERGFGFIKRDDGGPDVFLHVNDLKASRVEGPVDEGDRLSFETADPKGKGPRACNISRL